MLSGYKGIGKSVLALWAAAFSCSLVAIAAAFGKGDQLFAVFVFFGLGGFILLRYLGYFRFEFFGEGLSTLMRDRKSTRSMEQAVKDAEVLISQIKSFDEVHEVFSKVAEGIQIHEVKIDFFSEDGRLGAISENKKPEPGPRVRWEDLDQKGYYSRDKEFIAEFQISGRSLTYGLVQYTFMDGRSSLQVQEEVLLERVHDALSSFAARLRKSEQVI